jgi:hypothetical protein
MKTTELRFIEDVKQPFESSSGKTPQFMEFCRRFRSDFTAFLRSIGATDIEIDVGHFELYGFFTIPPQHTPEREGFSDSYTVEQTWYFDTGDLRWSAKQLGMLVRTAKDHKDFTGGRNNEIMYTDEFTFKSEMSRILMLEEKPQQVLQLK